MSKSEYILSTAFCKAIFCPSSGSISVMSARVTSFIVPKMFKEIICAVILLVTLNYVTHHIQRLVEERAELEEQVLFLTVKVGDLCELNKKLRTQNQDLRYEAAAAQRTLAMHKNEPTRRHFTRTEWEVGSEAWQALSADEKERVLNMTIGPT